MNWLRSQPWPPWTVTIPKPARLSMAAASANFLMVRWMISSGISFATMGSGPWKLEVTVSTAP